MWLAMIVGGGSEIALDLESALIFEVLEPKNET